MPLFLDPRGQSTYGIALCARCGTKRLLGYLVQDPNMGAPFLVCPECRDVYDPYRLAVRQPDQITLPYNRPDDALVPVPEPDGAIVTEQGDGILLESGGFILLESD